MLKTDAAGGTMLAGKRALVTGSTSGIGLAVARALHAEGAGIVLNGFGDEAEIDRLREELAADYSGANLMDANAIEAMMEEVGDIDILVNNAGMIHREASTDMALADWRRVLSVNLDSVWLLSQAAGRTMVARGSGRIIVVASVLGSQGGLRVPGYATSKHAVIGLTRALCNEWAPHGVNVNAIAPGYTATDNTAALRDDPERSKALLDRIPAGRFAEPDEMAGAAVFLASDAASYCHGSVLTVDGGWLAR